MRTMSCAENNFGKNSVESVATIDPPMVTTIGMYAAGCRRTRAASPEGGQQPAQPPDAPPPPPTSSKAEGTVFHNSLNPAFMHLE